MTPTRLDVIPEQRRDAGSRTGRAVPRRLAKVLVIGGGFAGMSAALRLAQLGVEVILLEQRKHLGGRAYSLRDPSTGDVVDNGQHVLTDAYSATRRFLRALGNEAQVEFQDNLHMDLIDVEGSSGALHCPGLPAPLHLLVGLLRMPGLTMADRIAGLRLGWALRRDHKANAERLDALTADQWLRQSGQTPRLRRMLWDPLTLAIVNETPERASALPLVRALGESFLGRHERGRMGFPTGGLSTLYESKLAHVLEAEGGSIRNSARVASLQLTSSQGRDRVTGLVLADGEKLVADAVILAVPHHAVSRLLPLEWRDRAPFAGLEGLGNAPIVSVHLWFDREITALPFVGLLGTVTQWVFNRKKLATDVDGHLLTMVISAAHEEAALEADVLVARTLEDLRRAFPTAREASLVGSRVIKEHRATFSARPGTDRLRPGPETPIDSLCLAGDWTATNLPATIEGAVRSGFRAAETVLLACRAESA